MSADPYPDEVIAVFNGNGSMRETDSYRPELAEFLEAELRVTRILLEPLEVPSSSPLNMLRETVKMRPESGGCPMR